jgi:hypothetical protein
VHLHGGLQGQEYAHEQNLKCSKDGEHLMHDMGCYSEIVDVLLDLTTCARPDLAGAVGVLARFIPYPRQEHWVCAKGVLHYLRPTAESSVIYSAADSLLEDFADSDCVADPVRRRSTGGFTFLLADGTISWRSKLLPTVARSLREAKHVAQCSGAKLYPTASATATDSASRRCRWLL